MLFSKAIIMPETNAYLTIASGAVMCLFLTIIVLFSDSVVKKLF